MGDAGRSRRLTFIAAVAFPIAPAAWAPLANVKPRAEKNGAQCRVDLSRDVQRGPACPNSSGNKTIVAEICGGVLAAIFRGGAT